MDKVTIRCAQCNIPIIIEGSDLEITAYGVVGGPKYCSKCWHILEHGIIPSE